MIEIKRKSILSMPGTKLKRKNVEVSRYKRHLKTKSTLFDKVLPPTVIANRASNTTDKRVVDLSKEVSVSLALDSGLIHVEAFAFINSILDLDPDKDFKFFYDITLDFNSNYQLLIYISYNKKTKKTDTFDMYHYFFTIRQDLLMNSSREQLPISNFGSVKVFVVDRDPTTSRGTETTVQPGVGNG